MNGGIGVAGNYPIRSLTGVQVLSTGSFVPDQVVTNADLQQRLGFDPDWILQRSGIRERRIAPPDISTSDMAIAAAQRCLQRANVPASEVDLVLLATFTPDVLCPATACYVQDKLGITAPAMDIQAACAGFMYALITGMQFIATGNSKRALVIGADCNSRIVNPRDIRTYPLFGDGAGAVLLAAGEPDQGLTSYTFGSDGSGAELLVRPAGGTRLPLAAQLIEEDQHYLQMDGRSVFKWAVRLVADSVQAVLQPSNMSPSDLDLFVAHQANVRILNSASESLGLRPDQVYINLDRFGNTSAGSIPLALDELAELGRLPRGTKLVLCGFGAGLTWGTALMKW